MNIRGPTRKPGEHDAAQIRRWVHAVEDRLPGELFLARFGRTPAAAKRAAALLGVEITLPGTRPKKKTGTRG